MKKILLAVLACVAGVTLASCSGEKIDMSAPAHMVDTYKTYFTENYTTLNYLATQRQQNSDFYANFVDGLVENDRFGNFVPALEKSHTVSDPDANGDTTWTFELKDASWVDSKGKEYAKVTAEDFVNAGKYILQPSNGSEVTSMWFTFIKGADTWYNANFVAQNYDSAKETKDKDGNVTVTKEKAQADMLEKAGFDSLAAAKEVVATGFDATVGVKAEGGKVVYTVNGVKPYFYSVLTYSSFLPVNGTYLQEQGSDFGADKDHLLYCGGYIMDSFAPGASAHMIANKDYWDYDNLTTHQINLAYTAVNQVDDVRKLYENGKIDSFALTSKDEEGWSKYVTGGENGTGTIENPYSPQAYSAKGTGTSTYAAYFNLDREGKDGVNKENTFFGNWSVYTNETDGAAKYEQTRQAIGNADFRLAFTYGINFVEYIQNQYGEDKGFQYQSRGWTVPGLASADNHDYSWYFANEYAKHNPSVTPEEALTNLYNTAKKDIIYSPDKANEHLTAAYNALKDDVTFPVTVEVGGAYAAITQANVEDLAKKINELFKIKVDGKVIQMVNMVVYHPTSEDDETAKYYSGAYDFNRFTGWGPDYADPLTFLNTWVQNGDFYPQMGTNTDYLAGKVKEYTDLVNVAKVITDDKARFEAYAKAEYQLIFKDAFVLPFLNAGALTVRVSRVLPYTAERATSGLGDAKYKGLVVASRPLRADEYQTLRGAFRLGDSAKLEAAIAKIAPAK